jgi:hypothetical protein
MNRQVLPPLVGYASFVDTIAVSVRGARRKRPQGTVRIGRNVPIGGGRSSYARSQRGVCCLSGNPFEVRYGRFHPNRLAVPENRVIFRSEVAPVNNWSATAILDALFRRGYKATVSQFELTFDMHTEIEFLAQHALCQLRVERCKSTIYFGSPHSKWQVRVYEKAPSIVRIEFVLRRGLLRSCGIESLDCVARVTQLDLFNWFQLRELRETPAMCIAPKHCEQWSTQTLYRFCSQKGLPFYWWTKRCPEERTLRRMFSRLMW